MGLPDLRSERVVLRPWTYDDVDALHAMFTTPDVRRYLWDDMLIPRETAVELVQSHVATSERHGIGYWTVILASAPSQLAGFCGFRFIDDGPEIELLYGLQAELWGKGLAPEACRTALEYLWNATGFQRVYARTDPPNKSSLRVMQRLGMAEESSTHAMISYLLQRPGTSA